MSRYLCVSVTFLDPLFHGKADYEEPEWPPSPLRLFQAMLAGSRLGCRNRHWSEAKADAFRWLESRDPPLIVAPPARRAPACTLFVPNNDADKKFERQNRLTSKVLRPHRLGSGQGGAQEQQTVHYLWAIDEGEWEAARPHLEVLCREARHLMALGWGIDQVVGFGRTLDGAEAVALSGQRWRPWKAFHGVPSGLRIPKEGTLDDLLACHESFLSSVKGKHYQGRRALRIFDRAIYIRETVLPPRSYAVFELPEGIAFPQEETIVVAAMLRSLVCREEHRRDFQELFAEDSEVYLAGHVNGSGRTPQRFSYLPLPTIGHEHADGMIRRLLIAEPHGGDGSHARWAQGRLRGAMLVDRQGNEWGPLLDLWRPGSPNMVRRYCDPSRIWSSVTPVVLPGFDDASPRKAERLLFKALRQAGVPIEAVQDVFLRKAPFWPGAHHPRLYRRPNYLKDFPAWHVALRFKEPICGPLAIGAGRHCGLGTFASEAE